MLLLGYSDQQNGMTSYFDDPLPTIVATRLLIHVMMNCVDARLIRVDLVACVLGRDIDRARWSFVKQLLLELLLQWYCSALSNALLDKRGKPQRILFVHALAYRFQLVAEPMAL